MLAPETAEFIVGLDCSSLEVAEDGLMLAVPACGELFGKMFIAVGTFGMEWLGLMVL
jgi:hypothetical protein